ncbi:GAF domain-containing sensor histidine kinase [Phytopseudomonas dryadis]|uniref:histidine kinase n=1 Tax=Phytopseudomonas dryadis TaxID=2487520 RepID=A0A4Q9R8G2_9GAMM|nr:MULTISPECIES: GAF domain-containing sensor histidine kinase [Pseudomonas]TBU96385.1 histidine kinase [Pseudomonas dryadis]TBV03559.1 histidine kinase [Pseudomonas dryadis]TBV16611.1 histidine kinase [Pseudomonas sp. FRB 230]
MNDGPSISADVAAIAAIDSVPAILQVVLRTTGMRFAAVARVTESRWMACAVHDLIDFGLQPSDELPLETTICNEIRQHRQPVIFGEASSHPLFSTHPIPKRYGFESYLSIPIIRANGEFFGTLCALDPLPARLDDPNMLQTLELLAQLIAKNLDMQERLQVSDKALLDAREVARLREQFIAVLGHDLRTPLNAIRLGSDLLHSRLQDARGQHLVGLIQASAGRMGELIDDVLDFARGHLGGGLALERKVVDDLGPWLSQVAEEVRTASGGRAIRTRIDLPQAIYCDRMRIGQALSNLLSNAVTHGSPVEPIELVAVYEEGSLLLTVSNHGPPIEASLMAKIFQPFIRSEGASPREGLGLGLYIAAQIAEAHEGSLSVTSSVLDGTCFSLRIRAEAPT